MNRATWLSIATITYVLPFWFPSIFWWCICIYPVGLIVAGVQYGIPWYIGYTWGVITYTLHLAGLYYGLIDMAEGSHVLHALACVPLSLYIALFPTIIFTCTSYIQRYIPHQLARVALWIVAILTLTTLLDTMSLIIFDMWEGNPLFHPIVPLGSVPQLISLLAIIGKFGYTLLILLVSGCIAYAIISPKKHHFMWILIAFIPWLISYYTHVASDAPYEDLKHITVIPILFPTHMDGKQAIEMANSTMRMAQSTYPDTRAYIFPESAFHRGDMDTMTDMWTNFHDNGRIIYGTFAWCNNLYRNSIHVVQDGKIVYEFHKRHAMPLTERIPYLLDYPQVRALYCSQEPEIVASSNTRTPLTLIDGQEYIPYMCSELLMHNAPDDDTKAPILFIGQDMWVSHAMSSYISTLMLLHARTRAIAWHRPIMYVTYMHAYYITSSGELTPLQVFA